MKRFEDPRDPEGPSQFELDGWIAPSPFEKLCGMEIVEARGGEAVLTMPFRVKLSMGAGLMHGGALTSLADTAVAMAIKSLLPEGSHFVTSGMSVRFLAPVRKGTVTARARVVRRDGRTIETVAEVFDDEGRKVTELHAPFKVLREGPA
jgi:uncharacterized protein (TIGR00369 family)